MSSLDGCIYANFYLKCQLNGKTTPIIINTPNATHFHVRQMARIICMVDIWQWLVHKFLNKVTNFTWVSATLNKTQYFVIINCEEERRRRRDCLFNHLSTSLYIRDFLFSPHL